MLQKSFGPTVNERTNEELKNMYQKDMGRKSSGKCL